ncbi:MAG: hypothetical protein ABFD94_18865 [Armatimonadia bacterium]
MGNKLSVAEAFRLGGEIAAKLEALRNNPEVLNGVAKQANDMADAAMKRKAAAKKEA